MTSHPSPDNLDPSQMDELLSRQDEVIQELEKLDDRLVQTIKEFRASIAKDKPAEQADSSEPDQAQKSMPKAA